MSASASRPASSARVTGMPNPAGLGALAATLNFIPIIGPVAMFVDAGRGRRRRVPDLGGGLMAPLAFAGMTFLEGHFVTPTIIGRRLALNALAVFIALAFWTWLWGPMGAFLSSPLLIVGADPEGASDAGQFAAIAAGLTGFRRRNFHPNGTFSRTISPPTVRSLRCR